MNDVYSVEHQRNWTGSAPFDHASGIWGRGRFIEFLSDRILRGSRVVDLGCGAGLPTTYLSSIVGSAGDVTGLDNSGPLIDAAKAFEENFSNIRFERRSVDEPLPFETNSIDWFVSFMTLQNLNGCQRHRLFAECNRCLKPNGRTAHLTLHPNFFSEEWSLDFVRYEPDGLAQWRSNRTTSFRVDGLVQSRTGGEKPVFAYPFSSEDIIQELCESNMHISQETEIHLDRDRAARNFPNVSWDKHPKGPIFWMFQTSIGHA